MVCSWTSCLCPISPICSGVLDVFFFQLKISLANELTHLRADGATAIGALLPVPGGVTFEDNSATGQLQLRINSAYARRFRRIFGYVGGVQIPPSDTGAVSRATLTTRFYAEFFLFRFLRYLLPDVGFLGGTYRP